MMREVHPSVYLMSLRAFKRIQIVKCIVAAKDIYEQKINEAHQVRRLVIQIERLLRQIQTFSKCDIKLSRNVFPCTLIQGKRALSSP